MRGFVCLFVFCISIQFNPELWAKAQVPDVCLEGPFHKEKPGPESDQFTECTSWKDLSCCNVNLTLELKHHRVKNIYNYHYDRCGTLSAACEEFIKDEECFYQCEPMLDHYEKANKTGYIKGVPICKSYCNAWFEACKDDKTCVEDWLGDFNYTLDTNHCPKESECVTFAEMYTDGKGLCDKMWGEAFSFENDADNCMVMKFEGKNPNLEITISASTRCHFQWLNIIMILLFCMVLLQQT